MSQPKPLPPPPQPAYILRGHTSPIHALAFLRHNTLLLTADANGICVLWTLHTRRPLAVWAAHKSSVLAVAEWRPIDPASTESRIITHGRDHKIYVWRLPSPADDVPTVLPVDSGGEVTGKSPWLVAALSVNALNFCGFGFCLDDDQNVEGKEYQDALVAVPAALESAAVDIFSLPSTHRVHARIQSQSTTGMAMALSLRWVKGVLTLIAGYESGHVSIFSYRSGTWTEVHSSKPHTQPVLGLAAAPGNEWFLTTSADSLIVRHSLGQEGMDLVRDTKHAGLQGLAVRGDAKIFAMAGWDGKYRVWSAGKMKELAVLKWHRVGCYAVAFAEILDAVAGSEISQTEALVTNGDAGEVVRSGYEGALGALTVEQARIRRETSKHWLAGGAKDGKVSLWEIY
ncbi:WD40-repeat-containing domain protein [Sphaerosporella brunnea]|uniref:ASTRA-associated protein 1 n=1 Tax=Sphaerosporella brunnea TaxID=1250544 RepID=A0A5J5F135_9PEZI|nr:WD40-repeat-containing domain protein [Sphaerosporella brunnea]